MFKGTFKVEKVIALSKPQPRNEMNFYDPDNQDPRKILTKSSDAKGGTGREMIAWSVKIMFNNVLIAHRKDKPDVKKYQVEIKEFQSFSIEDAFIDDFKNPTFQPKFTSFAECSSHKGTLLIFKRFQTFHKLCLNDDTLSELNRLRLDYKYFDKVC